MHDPVAALCVLSDGFGPWIQVEGPVGIVRLPEAMDGLIDYYRRLSGEHPDWDDYRRHGAGSPGAPPPHRHLGRPRPLGLRPAGVPGSLQDDPNGLPRAEALCNRVVQPTRLRHVLRVVVAVLVAWLARRPATGWPDPAALEQALKTLSGFPPLVFAGEARALTASLGSVAAGQAFLLQAGDCAESFEAFSADVIRDKLRVILQMAVVMTYSSGVPVVKLGRIAGQYAKPRSSPTERVGDLELPAFRGHMVNDLAPTADARVPDPSASSSPTTRRRRR